MKKIKKKPKQRYRIQKLINPGAYLYSKPKASYMVLGYNTKGKAIVKNFRYKKEAESYIKNTKRKRQ